MHRISTSLVCISGQPLSFGSSAESRGQRDVANGMPEKLRRSAAAESTVFALNSTDLGGTLRFSAAWQYTSKFVSARARSRLSCGGQTERELRAWIEASRSPQRLANSSSIEIPARLRCPLFVSRRNYVTSSKSRNFFDCACKASLSNRSVSANIRRRQAKFDFTFSSDEGSPLVITSD